MVLNLQPTDPAAHEVKALLHRFHLALTIKVHLPLLELQAAWEELDATPPGDRLSNRDPGTRGKARQEDDGSHQPGSGASQHTRASTRGGNSLNHGR